MLSVHVQRGLGLGLGRQAILATAAPTAAVPPVNTASPTLCMVLSRSRYTDITYDKYSQHVVGTRHPYLHGYKDNSEFKVEGVSDKQFPVPLDWRRPAHVAVYKPGADGSGDLEGLPEVDPARTRTDLAGSRVLQSAPEEVRRVLSLEFARHRDTTAAIKEDLIRDVRHHSYDDSSLEVDIVKHTVFIRHAQSTLQDLTDRGKENSMLRLVTKVRVDCRRRLLGRLREVDYPKFEWLLERLNLVYKPRPYHWERIERRKHLRRLTDLWCDELKQSRLQELKDQLTAEQVPYLRQKADTLTFLMKEEHELGLEPTIHESDIEECLKKADEIEERLKNKAEEGEEKKYIVYEKEVINDKEQYIEGF